MDLEILLDADEGADVESVVGHVNALLTDAGVTVVILDEEPDAFPLVAVASDTVGRVIEIAGGLGVDVRAPVADRAQVTRLLSSGVPDDEPEETPATTSPNDTNRYDNHCHIDGQVFAGRSGSGQIPVDQDRAT